MKSTIKNILLLALRLWTGWELGFAGYEKFINMDQTIVRLNHAFGLSTPIIWMVVIGEILVGLGLIFGVWTRVAGLGGVIIMAGAVYFTHGQNMSAIEVLCAAFILMLIGGGAYAVTHCKCNKACCAVK